MKHFLFVISLLSMTIISFAIDLKTIYEWEYIDYQWYSPQEKQKAISSGNYNASSCALYGVDKAPDGRLFVTLGREKGVPASVTTVTDKMGKGGPLLRPYPNWYWYKNDNDLDRCEGITSVYGIYIKENYLFVVDCGKIGDDQVCDAKLLVFDLLTNKLIKHVIIPYDIANNKNGTGLLTTLTVFVPPCKDIDTATVLIADTTGYGLVIFDMHTSTFCRIESDFMKPTDTIFDIENHTIFSDGGIFGMTLDNDKLYYAIWLGKEIYKMKISRQLECFLSESEIDNKTELMGILSDQIGPIASKDHVIFYSNIPETSIMCADTSKQINFNNSEVIAQDSEKLQFPSAMKIIPNELLILTNRFQRIDDINDDINFRVLSIDTKEIRKETKCFNSFDKEERHQKCFKPPHKNGSKDGLPKNHKGEPRDGFPKNHKGKPTDHKGKPTDGFPKNHKNKPESKSPKKHGFKLPIP